MRPSMCGRAPGLVDSSSRLGDGTVCLVRKVVLISSVTNPLTLACVAFLVSGCGGSGHPGVVTPTVTAAPAVDPTPVPRLSAADQEWAALVRRQNQQLTDVARRAQSASSSYEFWQVSNEVISTAAYEMGQASTAGLSPCMAGVPSKWEAVLTGFTIGGAAGTGSTTLVLRDDVLATVAFCTSGQGRSPEPGTAAAQEATDPDRVGGPEAGRNVAGTSEQDKSDAEAACLRVGAGRGSFKCATWVLERAGSERAKYPSLAEEWTTTGG